MVFALWPSHLAEWAWESLAGEADWGIYGGSGDCRSGQICRSSAQHGTQQSSHSHTEMAARDGNCKTRYQKFSIDSLPEAISNEQTKRKGCPCYRNTASTLVLYRICQPNWLPKVGILHLLQGLIPSWLKKVKEKRREGGKGEKQGWEDEFVEVEWHPGKCQVGGKKHKSRVYLKTN